MSLEHNIKEACSLLTSERATERAKNVESLKTFFNGTAAPAALSENQNNQSGFGWDDVFEAINDYALKECEKFESSKKFDNVRASCTTLLLKSVSLANNYSAYVKCGRVIEACKFVLQSSRLSKAVGSIYLNLLHKHVLTCEYYQETITSECYEELLVAVIEISNQSHPSIDKMVAFRVMEQLVTCYSNYCHPVIALRNNCLRIGKMHSEKDPKLIEILLKIDLVLINVLAVEARYTVCEFGDIVLPYILRFYDEKADHQKKLPLFGVLNLFLRTYYPQGLFIDIKTQHVRSIAELIITEAIRLEKLSTETKFKGSNNVVVCEEFVQLSGRGLYQFLKSCSLNDTVIDEEPSAKRIKLEGIESVKCFQDVIVHLRRSVFPWLRILNCYTKLFPEATSIDIYVELLFALEELVTNTKCDWPVFAELTCRLLDKVLIYERHWETLFSSCARNSITQNASHESLHKILQKLINLDSVDSKMTSQLLKLYFDKAIPVTDSSLTTINILLTKKRSKIRTAENKNKLLDWIVKDFGTKCMKTKPFVALMINLIAKEVVVTESERNDETDLIQRLFDDVDNSILAANFMIDIWKESSKNTDKCERNCLTISQEIKGRIDNLIIEHLHNFLNEDIIELSLQTMKDTAISLDYLDILLKYDLIRRDEIKTSHIFETTKKTVRKIYRSIPDYIGDPLINLGEKKEVLQIITKWFSEDRTQCISELVREDADEHFFKSLHDVVQNEIKSLHNEADAFLGSMEQSEDGLKSYCLELFSAYCVTDADYRSDMVEFVLCSSLYDFSSKNDIKIAFDTMNSLIKCKEELLPLDNILKLVCLMCKQKYRNPDVVENILVVLTKLLPAIDSAENDVLRSNTFAVINGLLKMYKEGKYRPKTIALVFDSLTKIEQLSVRRKGRWKKTLRDLILEGIDSAIYRLRLYSCYCLSKMAAAGCFSSTDQFIESMSDVFDVEISTISENIVKDEFINRTSTSLHCLLLLGMSVPTNMHKTLAATIELTKTKSLNIITVKNMLTYLAKHFDYTKPESLISKHFLYVINYWCSKGMSVVDFPYSLLGFRDLDKLVLSYCGVLVPCDAFWACKGDLLKSDLLVKLRNTIHLDEEELKNKIFSTSMLLSLPQIAKEKYSIKHSKYNPKQEYTNSCKKLFNTLSHYIGKEHLGDYFFTHFGDLLLALVRNVRLDERFEAFSIHEYPFEVFKGVLDYFGEMLQKPLINQLCEDTPLKIHNILLNLWTDIENEPIAQNKIQCIEKYVICYELIPDHSQLEEYANSFVCNTLLHSLKNNINDTTISEAICKHFHKIITKLYPAKTCHVTKILMQIVELLNGVSHDLVEVNRLKGLIMEMDNDIQEMDVVDSGTQIGFCELEKLINAVNKNSCQNLQELHTYLRKNKPILKECYKLLEESQGFSEVCNQSILHKMIYNLSNIICDSNNEKCVTLACQCLGVIGACDLRTVVIMPPEEPKTLLAIRPPLYLTINVANVVVDRLNHSCPKVVKAASVLLRALFGFDDGKCVLDNNHIKSSKQKLIPFTSDQGRLVKLKSFINEESFNTFLNVNPFLAKPAEQLSHWIVRVFSGICDVFSREQDFIEELKQLCILNHQTATVLLPSLFGLLLFHAESTQTKLISVTVNEFFTSLFTYESSLSSDESSLGGGEAMKVNKAIVQCMLNVVDFVRLQCTQYCSKSERSLKENERYNYLGLNYLNVSRAACACGAPIQGVLYAELTRNELALELLVQCYKSLGENDAIEDESSELTAAESLYTSLLRYESSQSDSAAVTQKLVDAGLYGVASKQPSMQGHLAAHCYARLGDWNQIIDVDLSSDENHNTTDHLNFISNYEIQKYNLLKETMLNTRIPPNLWTIKMNEARVNVAKMLQSSNRENCRTIYDIMSKLQILEEIDCFYNALHEKDFSGILLGWDVGSLLPVDRVEYREPVLWQRGMMLDRCASFATDSIESVVSLQHNYGEIAVESGVRSWSERAVLWSIQLSNSTHIAPTTNDILGKDWSSKGQLLLARERHASGFPKTAIEICRKTLNSADRTLRAEALRQLGVWLSESREEKSEVILEKYLMKSHEALSSQNQTNNAEAIKIYLEIAKFADAEYKRVEEYMKSTIFENKRKCLHSMKGTTDSFKQSQQPSTMSKDERNALCVNERLSKLDEEEIKNTYQEREKYLKLALEYYLLYLRSCPNGVPGAVWRAASLWTKSGQQSDVLQVPSYKMLAVLPQLIPRMSTENEPFAVQLNELVERCCREHPHHALPFILAQYNNQMDLQAGGDSSQRVIDSEPRVKASKWLVDKLLKSDLKIVLQDTLLLSTALISLANHEPQRQNSRVAKMDIPASERLRKVKNLRNVLVPTITLPVRPDLNYKDIVSVVSFAREYSLVGGINAPKKLTCLGSDGVERPILLKGQDDMRQDAVMQQVFNIVNTLFKKDNNTLHLRTYKVVPLSRRSGVLEWCEGSIPIGQYLMETHKKYRPNDISPESARQIMLKCKDSSKNVKIKEFSKILNNFHPVFHHFFLQHFHSPVVWYERKRAFTNSVATTSMVGYILGIGDRHVQNILLDRQTAQVIHIDFGIAFEMGKALPTPETVPFRLTQDIVDGFGISGISGLFKKSCEKSLQLLRENSETLLTILEVLLYDPLYTWSVLPAKIKGRATKPNTTNNKEEVLAGQAGRALVVLAGKLLERMSVSGHVSSLIQTATDPSNLACLYYGWQPYL